MIDWEAIGAIGELVGAVAVVVTLAYFGMQMRHSAKVAEAESERETLLEWQRATVQFVQDGPRILPSLDGFQDVDEDEIHYCIARINDVVMAHLAVWRMWELGMISSERMETFDRKRAHVVGGGKDCLAPCGLRR